MLKQINIVGFSSGHQTGDPLTIEHVRAEAELHFGNPEAWLHTANAALNGETPAHVIDQGRIDDVLKLFFDARYIGVS